MSNAMIEAHGLACHFPNVAEPLFAGVDISLAPERQFLIGRNGIGKSILAAILAKVRIPSQGTVRHCGRVGYLSQGLSKFTGSVAEHLEVAPILTALDRVNAGQTSEGDLLVLEGKWDFAARLAESLEQFNLPESILNQDFSTLSGGQRTKIQLMRLYLQDFDFLILDEPTNHLDQGGRRWFCEWMVKQRALLIVSHDRQLLREATTIFELGWKGLSRFRGSWDTFKASKDAIVKGIENKEEHAKKQLRNLRRAEQKALEKSNTSRVLGEKARKDSGQSKLVLNMYVESTEGTSPSAAHGSERDSLPSFGSC